MSRATPEEEARVLIDAGLEKAGWVVQNRDDMNLAAGRGVAVREFRLAQGHGFADYLLFVDDKAVGALEAKPMGFTLKGVEVQSGKYSAGLPKTLTAHCPPNAERAPLASFSFRYGCSSMKSSPLRRIKIPATISAGHDATALTVLPHRTESLPSEQGRLRPLALQLVTTPDLIRSGQMTGYFWKQVASSLVSDFSGEIASAIFREQSSRPADTWFVEYSEAAHVLQACVERDPSAVWAAMLPHLSSKGNAYMFSIGFPRGVLERVPVEDVLTWLDENPRERAAIVAKLVSKNFTTDEMLAARVLGLYGGIKEVASAFFADYVSGSWSGPASAHWEHLAEEANAIAARTKLPRLRRWATKVARDLRRMAERDRRREEEEELRRH